MPTEVVSLGVPLSMVQNTVYALPGRSCVIFPSNVVDVSNDIAFGASSTVSTNTSATTAARYIRCTAVTNCVLMAKLV